ncbi:MAG: 16S rRNA (adenine(1518)-N(6)/adenine(1519)-N(6))-dimethyltransferase RsmA [Candidatus Margulisiibacteriota bacterium]
MKQFKAHKTKKHFSQNWLIDKNILQKIIDAAELTVQDAVLEIGTGTGFLTNALAESAGQVISYEVDREIQDVARTNLQQHKNITLILKDILDEQQNFQEVTGKPFCKVAANIPYHITTPILELLIKNIAFIKSVVLMVQNEIGDRITALPGTADFSSLSIYIQYHFQASKFWKVSRRCFKPPPNVDSALIKLIPHSTPPVLLHNEDLFFTIVHAAFWGRRKTLRNSLLKYSELDFAPADLDSAINSLGISPLERGENLGIGEFAALANKLFEMTNPV